MVVKTKVKGNEGQGNVLKENVRDFVVSKLGPDELDLSIYNSKDTRTFIVETIVDDVDSLNKYKVKVINLPITQNDIRELNAYNKELADLVVQFAKVIEKELSTSGASIVADKSEIEQRIGTELPDDIKIIFMNDVAFLGALKENRYSSPLWTMVHEVMHTVPKIDKDETSVQKKTFAWLLKHNYTMPIYSELSSQIIDQASGWGVYGTPYFILDFMVEELKREKPMLWEEYLDYLLEMFTADNIKETIKDETVLENILNWLAKELNIL